MAGWPGACTCSARRVCNIWYQLDSPVEVPGGSRPVDWLAAIPCWPDGPWKGAGRWSIADAVPVRVS